MVSSNLLVVESINDKYFVEAVKNHLNDVDLEIDSPVCAIDDFECLDGLSQARLSNKLKEVSIKIEKQGIEQLGILVDADNEGVDARLALINTSLSAVGSKVTILNPNEWYQCDVLKVAISCHVLNLNGAGELETLLRNIKSEESVYADCLNAWKSCLENNDKEISTKSFDKFWVNIYQRYDCCTPREQNQAARKCSVQASMSKGIWDFDHSSLEEFRDFLQLFR